MVDSNKRKPSKSNTSASAFKRIKAKVGKKVPKPANETDTKFKAASLHVSGQAIGNQHPSADTVLSEKGKSLLELSMQLDHPAPTARASAMKGLTNIVKHQSALSLQPHLHVLLQSCARSFVDEDDNVRKVGRSLLEEIVSRNKGSSPLEPFVSLLVAYTRSALHSLDLPMRQDGSRVLKILSLAFPSMITNSIPLLLPQLSALLSDRKKDKDLLCTLEGIMALLQHSCNGNNGDDDYNEGSTMKSSINQDTPTFQYMPGGRSRNAFLLEKRQAKPHCVEPLRSLTDWRNVLETSGTHSIASLIVYNTTTTPPASSFDKLRLGLRDVLVEMVEQETSQHPKDDLLSLQTVNVLVQVIRLAWATSNNSLKQTETDSPSDSVTTQAARLLMELFPITTETFKGASVNDLNSLNAQLTMTVFDIVSQHTTAHGMLLSQGSKWIDILLSYWLSPQGHSDEMSNTQFEVFKRLLTPRSKRQSQLPTKQQRGAILDKLSNRFLKSPDRELMRSTSGRMAALMLAPEILRQQSSPISEEDITRTAVFVDFLEAWAADFHYESGVILDALRNYVVKMGVGQELQTLQNCLREKLATIVTIRKDKTLGTTVSSSLSIFESYPNKLKHSFLGLIRMLESPTKAILKGLGQSCAAKTIHHQSSSALTLEEQTLAADEIVETIYAIRKTVSLPDFLSFIISTLGVPSGTSATGEDAILSERSLRSFDHRMARVSHALVGCGPIRVLKMTLPQLQSWLDIKQNSSSDATIFRCRAAFRFLTVMSYHAGQGGEASPEAMDAWSRLVKSLCGGVVHTLSMLSKRNLSHEIELLVLHPFLALVGLLETVSVSASKSIESVLEREDISDIERKKLSTFQQQLQVQWPSHNKK